MKKILNYIRQNASRIIICIGISLIFIVWNAMYNPDGKSNNSMNYTELIDHVNDGEIERITLNSKGNKAKVKLKEDKIIKTVIIPSEDSLTELITNNELEGNHIDYSKKETSNGISGFMSFLLKYFKFIIFIYLLIIMIQFIKYTAINNENSSIVDIKNRMNIKFSDVAGIEPQKEELEEIVSFLKDSKKYEKMGAKTPKGILLYGNPGTGKTLLAKAIAGEAGVSFFYMSGSEFEQKFVGVGASRVRNLFEKARNNAPSIIFIDELDSIGGKRGGKYNYSEQTLNQLLVEMDGFKKDDIIVIAATNRIESLDPAILRPGRFDRKIFFPIPDKKGREEILKIHTKSLNLMDNVNLKEIASKTAGFTGADLANISNEAAIIAVRNDHDAIFDTDMNEALRKQIIGIAQKDKFISDDVKKLVSYHEAGHALVSYFIEEKIKVVEISIISRGYAGGYTMYEDTDDNINFKSKSVCLKNITSLLAGRAAEKLVLGDVSTGAYNDIEKAYKAATLMVTKFGMSDVIGPISLSDEEISCLNKDFTNPINVEINNILKECSDKADKILKNNIYLLHLVAQALIDNETISGEELVSIICNN